MYGDYVYGDYVYYGDYVQFRFLLVGNYAICSMIVACHTYAIG